MPIKPSCEYCGNNPVPHFIYWYNESLNVLFTPVRQLILYNPASVWLKKSGFAQKFFLRAVKFLLALKILRRQGKKELCKVRRAQVLWEEADKRGIKMTELLLLGRPFDTYLAEKIGNEKAEMVFSGLPRPTGYSNRLLDLMDDKWLFKKIILQYNLPVPAGGSAVNFRQAKKIFRQIKNPVIVKPRVGSRGRHSTTFVYDEAGLKKAFWAAKKLCHWVVVEEQLFGPIFRGTVINFKTEGVLRGDPPQVAGDGVSSIAELVKKKNSAPRSGVKEIQTDGVALRFLKSQNLSWDSIPEPGETINLSEKIGVSYGGSSSEDYEVCHPDNILLFEQAARALGDPIVGFDFIISDITQTYKAQRCGFIEVNSLPFINLHHDPLHGNPRNVAAAVWNMLGW